MSRLLSALLATAAALGATGAEAATRAFPVGGFSRIQSNVPFDVHVHTGAAPSVRAQGPQDALDRLIVEVVNGELVIRSKPGSWWSGWNWRHEKTLIEVTGPMLTAATLSGAGDLTIDLIRARDFNATLRGPGDLTIDAIEAGNASFALDGPGDLTVKGRAATAHVTLRGPGDVRAGGLTVRDATVNLSGPGDVALGATGVVSGTLSGPGDISIRGGARCQISKHGPGDVSCH